MSSQEISAEATALYEAMDRLLTELSETDCDSPQYTKMMEHVSKLSKVIETETNLRLKHIETDLKVRESNFNSRINAVDVELKSVETLLKERELNRSKYYVSPDTMAIVAANLVGIVAIIGYERANVIASKAMSLLTKLR